MIADSQQPLNGLDIALRSIDRTIRDMGFPGFETQMLVWLNGPADTNNLRRAIQRLGVRHPVITSRLVEQPGKSPVWQFRPGELPPLEEQTLTLADPVAVLTAAANLLSTPRDPANSDPLRFHLLHRPGGGDVFLMQYNHVLMDNSATNLLLREIDQLATSAGKPAEETPRYEPRFLVGRYLRKIPHAQRRAATQVAIEAQTMLLRGQAALLGDDVVDKPRCGRLQIVSRTIEPDEARAIRARAIAVCGLPSLSMTILGSALRAIQQVGPQSRNAGRRYMAGIGLDLDLRVGTGALLQNLLGLVPINAHADELADRDGLVRLLSAQMRSRLVTRNDIGVMRLAHTFQRRPRFVSWVMTHLLRHNCSLWYAYFGAQDALGPNFGGGEIERIHYVGPTWGPMGIALLVNQFHGRLLLHLTHDPEIVPPPLAAAYLDCLLADLREFAAAHSAT